jgi:hypothetical protein
VSEERTLAAVWNNGDIPVIAVPVTGRIKIRIPYSDSNRAWLQIGRSKPEWDKVKRHWTVPRCWLTRMSKHAVKAFGRCYIVQAFKESERCAPACWNAAGLDCSCSCLGENHGQGDDGSWYVVDDVFACRAGGVQYAVRLIAERQPKKPTKDELSAASGIKWHTYFARVSGSQMVKIGSIETSIILGGGFTP